MEITQVKINELKPAEYNPRKLTKDQHAQLTESIKKFGIVDPIIVNKHEGRENIIVGGHMRWRVAKEMGFTEVPVYYVDLDEEKERELNLRLNKNLGEWDWDMLANQFDEATLKDVGFSDSELGFMQSEGEEDDFDAEAEAAKITTPESKLGEVYELGNHRLMCGSSTELVDVEKLMNGVKADLVFTDPPYMVDYHSPAGVSYHSEKFGGDGGKIFNDNLKAEDAIAFYTAVLKNLKEVTTDMAPIYWWHASQKQHWNHEAFMAAGWKFSQAIVWIKNSMVLGRQDFHRCFEPCMFGWKEGKTHYVNKKIANLKDVWAMDVESFSDMLDVWFEKRDNTAQYVHPTQKPVRLAGRGIRKSSVPGGAVVDLFGGSGSTLIACEQLGRRAFLMELDPKYCDVIRKRYKQFTERGTQG